ncbi:MAG: pyruvate kinase [Eggerthellaceae bacterium]|nr:pyruvate kinase [Eggerthellaceae bacterium]
MARKTKIICTLGPAVDGDATLRDLLHAGMNVARLNFSHGSHAEHAERIRAVRRASEETGIPCAIMLDTKGPEIRTGLLAGGRPIDLSEGDTVVLTPDENADGSDGRIFQTCPDLAGSLALGARLLVDDGLIGLAVTRLEGADIECVVTNDGTLGQRKSINAPGVQLPLPAVTEQDRADLLFGIQQGVDIVAASFVRDDAGVREIKRFLADNGGEGIGVIAKVEAAGALDNIHGIVAEADGIMVARGDLGVEVPAYRVPYLQKEIIRLCNRESKPVIIATQMLDSMIRNPRPTRAEVADVANAIYDGTDCVMLSGETASGKHPVDAVRAMACIAAETEPHLYEGQLPDRCRTHARASLAVGIAAVQTAETLNASCIIAPTVSGRTARLISKLRPRTPIYAVTPDPRVMRQMLLSWGVTPLLDDMQGDRRHVMGAAIRKVRLAGFAKPGDLAVITTGDVDTAPDEDIRPGVTGIAPTSVMQVVQVR